ncbi:MAG: branched-chain amino acid transaminase [Magnetococcales bacterium]|nr:branched-chain amino acid transaminase [Magnetococcales bacterium]
MFDRDGFIWMNGALVPWREAKVHVLTHTLHYGMGVFEGIRCYDTVRGSAVFRLKEHIKRLFRSAHILGMPVPFDEPQIAQACLDVIKSNELKAGYIRPLFYYGAESMGLNPKPCKVHGAIAAWQWGAYLGEEGMEKGIRIKTSSYSRHHPNVTMTRAKAVGNYANSILAKSEALSDGYDEALLLDTDGYVAEGSGENLFIYKDEVLKTPPLDSALDGITRDSVIAFAREMGIPVVEQRFPRDEVLIADEAFFTGTAAEVTPIREMDNRRIGPGHAGPITKAIQKRFFDVVNGRDEQYLHWLTPVNG